MNRHNLADLINFLGEECGDPGYLISLSPEEMKNVSTESTGLYDFGNGDWEEGYIKRIDILHALNPHTLARLKLRSDILRLLRNRLIIIDEIKRNPRILDEKIENPIFITGNPRTGTTILFEMLSQDQSFRSPKLWEVNCPIALPAARMSPEEISKNIDEITNSIQPNIKLMHELRWDLPVECTHIMDSIFFNFSYDFKNIEDLAKSTRPIESYNWHKIFLQLLQYRSNEKRTWLLKSPFHMYYLDELYAVYPDAKIIHTHRDPAKFLCSYANIMKTLNSSLSSKPIEFRINTDIIKECLKSNINKRMGGLFSNKKIADINYLDLMKNPNRSIKDIYRTLGINEPSKNTIARIDNYLEVNPQYRNGKYINKPEELGIEENKIREEFSFYIEHYNVMAESP